MSKIGLPRGLLYYEFAPLWTTFFEALGAEVVVSPKTNKKILDDGTRYCVDDACIPVKVFHGHVLNLKNKVDTLFIPRIMGIHQKEYICPKFCGLPEMIKYSINDLPKMINTKIDYTKKDQSKRTMNQIASYITTNKKTIQKAYQMANQSYTEYKKNQKELLISNNHNIMIMGHPYIIYDDFLNMSIKKKLKKAGLYPVTYDIFDESILNKYALGYHGKIFWLFFRKMIGACLYLIDHKLVDGVIYLSSFGCGIDSVVAETVERNIRRNSQIPFMLITIDEHSGEAGFNTRLEAFIDMLKWRNKDENYLSPYGDYVYSR